MVSISIPSIRSIGRIPALLTVPALLLLLAMAAVLVAQVSGERGIAPIANSTDIDVGGIEVNVTGDSPEDAREKGWRVAQRKAWEKLDGPKIPDSRLESLVSAIVVEQETLGPRRYIATLGVIFDRARAGGLLGAAGTRSRSAPMLTLPVLVSGGTRTLFEVRSPWQRAWAEEQTGASAIDYVRPNGAGGESLILTAGQTGRRSRAWWNEILDQFGAADVLVPVADLHRRWPGGPIEGRFTARFGPDSTYLQSFTMNAENDEQLPAMLKRAVLRMDEIYSKALADGKLAPDPTLALDAVEISPELRALVQAARRAEALAAMPPDEAVGPDVAAAPVASTAPTAGQAVTSFVVQVATPDAASFGAALASLRSAPGVRGVATSSTAIGGTSVMRVSFSGDLAGLAVALRQRGWSVTQGTNALGITR